MAKPIPKQVATVKDKKINYGKKELVGATVVSEQDRKKVSYPMYYLAGYRDGRNRAVCYCTECRNTFNVSDDIAAVCDQTVAYANNTTSQTPGSLSDGENVCPECGNEGMMYTVQPQPDKSASGRRFKSKSYHVGAYEIPMIATGRYQFMYKNDKDEVTRIDSNVMMHSTIIYPSGKVYHFDTEYSRIYDMVQNQVRNTKTIIMGDKRKTEDLSMLRPFGKERLGEPLRPHDTGKYCNPHQALRELDVNLMDPRDVEFKSVEDIEKEIMAYDVMGDAMASYVADGLNAIPLYPYSAKDMTSPVMSPAVNASSSAAQPPNKAVYVGSIESMYKVAHLIADARISKDVDPFYLDFEHNGLFVKNHRVGDTENLNNNRIQVELYRSYMRMMTVYPRAFEYACAKTDTRLMNFGFEQKQKTGNADYSVKDIPDSVKAKIFREEVAYTMMQVAAVDDNIRATIMKAKDVDDLKSQLAYYVFGKNEKCDITVPFHVRLYNEGNSMQPGPDPTTELRETFKQDMLGVANTCYTARKLSIYDTEHLLSLVRIGQESPSPKPKRIHSKATGKTFIPKQTGMSHYSEEYRGVGTIAPIMDRTAMRYFKSVVKGKTPDEIISIYADKQTFDQHLKNIDLFEKMLVNNVLPNTAQQKDDYLHAARKAQVKLYMGGGLLSEPGMGKALALHSHTKEEAYRAFALQFGSQTKELVDQYVEELRKELADTEDVNYGKGQVSLYRRQAFRSKVYDELFATTDPEQIYRNLQNLNYGKWDTDSITNVEELVLRGTAEEREAAAREMFGDIPAPVESDLDMLFTTS